VYSHSLERTTQQCGDTERGGERERACDRQGMRHEATQRRHSPILRSHKHDRDLKIHHFQPYLACFSTQRDVWRAPSPLILRHTLAVHSGSAKRMHACMRERRRRRRRRRRIKPGKEPPSPPSLHLPLRLRLFKFIPPSHPPSLSHPHLYLYPLLLRSLHPIFSTHYHHRPRSLTKAART